MATAVFVLMVSFTMVIGGRTLMRYGVHSKIEGMLSSVVGAGFLATWYRVYPSDFGDLGDFVGHSFHRMWSHEGAVPFTFAALVPSVIALVMLLLMYPFGRSGQPKVVRSIFGPLGQIRRPKFLR